MSEITILGAGIAGLGAAYHTSNAGAKPVIYEKLPHPYGHTSSHEVGAGFVFDEGPHVSFTKVDRIQKLLADNVEQRYEIIQTYVNNYWKGHWIKHPAICNLHGLPSDVVTNIIKDFASEHHSEPKENFANFAEWLTACYGKTYAETFPFEYNLKYHTTHVSNLSTDWLGPRLYRASIDEVIKGALEPETPDVHYIDHFRYPTYGGFQTYLKKFAAENEINLNHELTSLDPKSKTLYFANGETRAYDALVSSLPLPELIKRIVGAPEEVKQAAEDLACSICVCVSIGIDRPEIEPAAHWSYFYDRDIIFTRTSMPHLLSPKTVPEGTSSIQCEVYYSKKYKPLDRSLPEIEDLVISDLKKCGFIKDDDKILCRDTRYIPYANIIFDLDRAKNVAIVHGYLDDLGIKYCGRYGDWGYMWTDQSFMSGEKAAEKALLGS